MLAQLVRCFPECEHGKTVFRLVSAKAASPKHRQAILARTAGKLERAHQASELRQFCVKFIALWKPRLPSSLGVHSLVASFLEMSAKRGEIAASSSLGALHEFTLTLYGIASSEHVVGGAVRSHLCLLEFHRFGTGRRAVEPINPAAKSAEMNGGRRGDEVNLTATFAHDGHMDRHGTLLCRASPR